MSSATYIRKQSVLWARNLAALSSLPDLVVASLHQPALQHNWILEERVGLGVGQVLERGVELGDAVLCEQEQQVETRDLVLVLAVDGGEQRG